MFFDEEMLLDFRLNYLNKYVDNFVIVESAFTHSGQKRELLFDIEKFKKYKDKICYIAIEQEPDNLQKIYEDDVKCSHGSTTGQIDEEAIFYFRSRGISRMEAMELMVKGFANEVVDKVENDKLKTNIQKVLAEKMEGMI